MERWWKEYHAAFANHAWAGERGFWHMITATPSGVSYVTGFTIGRRSRYGFRQAKERGFVLATWGEQVVEPGKKHNDMIPGKPGAAIVTTMPRAFF